MQFNPDAADKSVDRRTFLRAAGLGLTLPFATGLLTPASAARARRARTAATTTTTAVPRISTLRIGVVAPVLVADPAIVLTATERLATALVGDHLCATDAGYALVPRLATSWRANASGTEWLFSLRPAVTFHDGTALDADDVVATFRRILSIGGSAASPLLGYLSAADVNKVDSLTVRFRLSAPTGSFPYLVSSENPGAVITPAKWRPGPGWFVGTGSWRPDLTGVPGELTFARSATAWRSTLPAVVSRIVLVPVGDESVGVDNVSSGRLDALASVSPSVAASLLGSSSARVQVTRTAAHTQIHMRTDQGPFKDVRTRQALALSIDRAELVRTHMSTFADIGDDSPVAPSMPASSSVARSRDVALAKRLMKSAGLRRGFDTTLSLSTSPNDASLATALAASATDIGIRIVPAPSPTYLQTDWLTSDFGITNYEHRINSASVLGASLASDGAWNAAHYRRSTFDTLVRTYATSLDLGAQRVAAHSIWARLQQDTPVLIPFFRQRLALFGVGFSGWRFTAVDQLDTV